MANTDPQAVRLANERFRAFADRAAQFYHFSRILQAQNAATGAEALFVGAKELIEDGSLQDGRAPLTNDDVKALLQAIDDVVTFFDKDPERRDLLLRTSVNPLNI